MFSAYHIILYMLSCCIFCNYMYLLSSLNMMEFLILHTPVINENKHAWVGLGHISRRQSVKLLKSLIYVSSDDFTDRTRRVRTVPLPFQACTDNSRQRRNVSTHSLKLRQKWHEYIHSEYTIMHYENRFEPL
jgi:hypothetical protein